jgi:hypothetical protein
MTFDSNARAIKIFLSEGDSEELLVSPASDRKHYRLEESSLFGELRYHDIISADTQPDGSLRLLQVEVPSDLKSISWILPEHAFELPSLSALLQTVIASGGNWERTFGGMLTLHVPPAEEVSTKVKFETLFRNSKTVIAAS